MDDARVVKLMAWENVLFPGMLLPLHVDHPDDLLLVHHCLDGSGEFGMVLETDDPLRPQQMGTVAKIIDYQPEEDGKLTLLITGMERFAIAEMVGDEPYLTGMIEPSRLVYDMPSSELAIRAAQARRLFRRCVKLIAAQRDMDVHDLPDLPSKTSALGWAIASVLAIPPEERQRLLEKETAESLLQTEILYLESLLVDLRYGVEGD
jgi:ATP-dependent Lon protease